VTITRTQELLLLGALQLGPERASGSALREVVRERARHRPSTETVYRNLAGLAQRGYLTRLDPAPVTGVGRPASTYDLTARGLATLRKRP
jgi:DNA-binding PadR family transcriptional regulator